MTESLLPTVHSSLLAARRMLDVAVVAIEIETNRPPDDRSARKLAAFDDLLNALHRIVNHTAMLPPNMDEPGSVLAQARAAIAKAEAAR